MDRGCFLENNEVVEVPPRTPEAMPGSFCPPPGSNTGARPGLGRLERLLGPTTPTRGHWG